MMKLSSKYAKLWKSTMKYEFSKNIILHILQSSPISFINYMQYRFIQLFLFFLDVDYSEILFILYVCRNEQFFKINLSTFLIYKIGLLFKNKEKIKKSWKYSLNVMKLLKKLKILLHKFIDLVIELA